MPSSIDSILTNFGLKRPARRVHRGPWSIGALHALEHRILLDDNLTPPPAPPVTTVAPTVSPAQPGYTYTGYIYSPPGAYVTTPPPTITVPATSQNVPASAWWTFWNGTGPVGLKATLIGTYGTPPVTVLPGSPPPSTTIGVGGGSGYVFTNIPPGTQVGPSGMGPCIGVTIVSPPDANGNVTVWAYHFTSTDNPAATLQNSGGFPPGSTVVISGGMNTEPNSMGTLQSVNTYLTNDPNLTVIGYYNTTALYVDGQGNFYVYQTPLNLREDPTIVQPPVNTTQP